VTARYLSCGDAAFSVELGDAIDRGLSLRVLSVKAAIERAPPDGLVEIVPSYRALLIHFDPLQTDRTALIGTIEPLLDSPADPVAGARRWHIPCCYEPEFATDMESVARALGLDHERVVALHSGTEHYVYMLGFAPGQPYAGDLPPELDLPRRADPVLRIEQGSVVIATGLTVIYPVANATGWHVIGRTPVSLFDQHCDPPALFAPGDRIVFEAVSADRFREIEALVRADRYVPRCEAVGAGGAPAGDPG
jgi:inhibitor of KinA